MKKLFIVLLSCTMILSGCSKKVEYKQAIDQLVEKYAGDTKVNETVQNFVDTALEKVRSTTDIKDIGFMTTDSFDNVKNFVEEHKTELKYISIGIGGVVVVNGICIFVLKTAFVSAVCGLIANYVKNNDKIQLHVSEMKNAVDGFKEEVESSDLVESLKDGQVIILQGFSK